MDRVTAIDDRGVFCGHPEGLTGSDDREVYGSGIVGTILKLLATVLINGFIVYRSLSPFLHFIDRNIFISPNESQS